MSNQFTADQASRISRAVRAYEADRTDKRTSPAPHHRPIGGGLPTGQYQYQFFGMVSQNQTGFMFIPANSLEQEGT